MDFLHLVACFIFLNDKRQIISVQMKEILCLTKNKTKTKQKISEFRFFLKKEILSEI